jgi:hypothetical protein
MAERLVARPACADFRLDDQKARPVKTSASTGKTELRSNAYAQALRLPNLWSAEHFGRMKNARQKFWSRPGASIPDKRAARGTGSLSEN